MVTIDRPPVNALGPDDWEALGRAVADIDGDARVRVAVLAGTARAFCAGADIGMLAERPAAVDDASMLATVGSVCAAVRRLRVPVLAAIEGPAHGGGLELALACDIRLASRNATLAASSVNMGLIASVRSLVDTVGTARAARLLLTGQRIPASTADVWGLVTDLVDGDVVDAAVRLAEHMSSRPPLAVEAIKRATSAARTLAPPELDQLVSELFDELAETADHREALESFLEKRPGSYGRR